MATEPVESELRFPWGYFAASLLPMGLIGLIFILPALLGPQDSMGPAMLCSMLIAPVGAIVVGWGLFRLWQGEGRRFPSLRWLVWIPAVVGIAGFLLG
jgi:hypothetical protein